MESAGKRRVLCAFAIGDHLSCQNHTFEKNVMIDRGACCFFEDAIEL